MRKFGARTILIPIAAVAMFYIVQLVVASFYSFILMFIDGAMVGIEGGVLDIDSVEDLLMKHMNNISAVYSVLVIIISSIVLSVLLKQDKFALRRERYSAGHIVSSLLIMSGITGLISLQMAGLVSLGETVPYVGKVIQEYIELSQAFIGNGNVVMIILSTCILVPISEELVFRGIIQGELRRALPVWAAIAIQAVIFALVHGNIVQISYVIIPAIILGLVYEWTKSIYVPIIMHMFFNFIGSALPEMLNYNETAMMYLGLIQIAFIPVAVIALFYLKAIRKTDDMQDDRPDDKPDDELIDEPVYERVQPVASQVTWKHRDL